MRALTAACAASRVAISGAASRCRPHERRRATPGREGPTSARPQLPTCIALRPSPPITEALMNPAQKPALGSGSTCARSAGLSFPGSAQVGGTGTAPAGSSAWGSWFTVEEEEHVGSKQLRASYTDCCSARIGKAVAAQSKREDSSSSASASASPSESSKSVEGAKHSV